ncbi:hypothetical protein [Coleofasciculus sp. H7-2]|uniref:hypothetical protein n=1 Tax=Coleofasciculus sp. H7-2 TaxID=3351545 RepID=UPI00366EDB0E
MQKDNYSKAKGWRDGVHQSANDQVSVKEAMPPFSVCGLGFQVSTEEFRRQNPKAS